MISGGSGKSKLVWVVCIMLFCNLNFTRHVRPIKHLLCSQLDPRRRCKASGCCSNWDLLTMVLRRIVSVCLQCFVAIQPLMSTSYYRCYLGNKICQYMTEPRRTNKQCRERWLNHVNPDVTRAAWSAEEDRLVETLQARVGNHWAKIAKALPGISRYCVVIAPVF